MDKKTPKFRFKGFSDTWEQRKLGELGTTYTGISGKTSSDFGHGDARFITYMNVYSNAIANPLMVEPIEIDQKQNEVKVGDVFFTTSSETPDEVGLSSVLLEKQGTVYLNSFCFGYRPKEKIDLHYLAFMLRSEVVRKKIIFLAQGISRYNISKNKMMEISVPLPTIEEQSKIGGFLNNLDNLITLHQRKLDKLSSLKKAYLEKMFPKKGKLYPELRFAGFTDAWEQRKFGSILKEIRDKTIVEDQDTLLSCAIDGMYLNSELFSHFRGSSNIGYLKIKKNDLILSAQNLHLGNCNVNLRFDHGIISPAYKVFELVNCDPLFMHAWVKQEATKNFFLKASTEGASVCRKNIVWEDLYKQELPLPNIKEQEKIGSFFSHFDNIITLHQRKLDKLKQIKSGYLNSMFI